LIQSCKLWTTNLPPTFTTHDYALIFDYKTGQSYSILHKLLPLYMTTKSSSMAPLPPGEYTGNLWLLTAARHTS